MNAWRALPQRLAEQGDQVLVTVAALRGSGPREVGASMLVGAQDSCDTIGGGRLEWEAIALSRDMLASGATAPVLHRFPLAASLGQCCGGVVWLLFERIAAGDAISWQERLTGLEQGQVLKRACGSGEPSAWSWGGEAVTPLAPLVRGEPDRVGVVVSSPEKGRLGGGAVPVSGTVLELKGNSSVASWQFTLSLSLPHFPVAIFGAGHVGEAIVRALLPLEAQVRWIDTREDVFPPDLAAQVRCIATDAPEQEIAALPPGSFVLVLTHSHALDLELCAVGLRRDDLGFFGLIGSRAKRARFEQRLVSRGLDPLRLARLVCPIGVAGIRSKLPAAIAVAVVAQLLQVREQASPSAPAIHEREHTATQVPC